MICIGKRTFGRPWHAPGVKRRSQFQNSPYGFPFTPTRKLPDPTGRPRLAENELSMEIFLLFVLPFLVDTITGISAATVVMSFHALGSVY